MVFLLSSPSTAITEWRTYEDLRTLRFTYAEVADVLDAAADSIERNGWCQGILYEGSKRCVRGGLWQASGADRTPSGRSHRLMTVAEEALGYWLADQRQEHEPVHVPTWNDAQCQSEEQAVAALRGCAAFVRRGDEGL